LLDGKARVEMELFTQIKIVRYQARCLSMRYRAKMPKPSGSISSQIHKAYTRILL
jgi:hypothetical protein